MRRLTALRLSDAKKQGNYGVSASYLWAEIVGEKIAAQRESI